MPRAFNVVPTGIGSLPFTDVNEACGVIFQHVPEAQSP
jgi:hypothetical protein